MAAAVAEFQSLLAQLAVELGADVARFLDRLGTLDLSAVTVAYPQMLDPYLGASADLTCQWYEEQPGPAFAASPAPAAAAGRLAAQARWAVLQADPLPALQGKASQMLFDVSRRTVAENAGREGVQWARHASVTACPFCRMLAIRGATYRTEVSALRGHPKCHCLAVPDRDGRYEPAPYVERWQEQYDAARGAATSGKPQAILAEWARILRSN